MLLFETKLPFASTCRSTWPLCASVTPYIAGWWGRYGTKDITRRSPKLAFPLVQFYGAVTVWSMLQSASHIYSNKPTCCQNNPTKSLLWMHLHLFQYLYHLTHWGQVTHICVGKLTIIGSDNGLSPERRQAIIWTNAGILLIGSLGTNFNEISIEIQTFSLKKIRLKMSSAKCCSFRLGLNVLTWIFLSPGR